MAVPTIRSVNILLKNNLNAKRGLQRFLTEKIKNMDIVIKNATIDDLKRVQELNLLLFEKEHREYDSSLNLN